MKFKKIFFRYCLKYFMAFLVVLLCCLPIGFVAYRTVRNQILNINQLKLKEGAMQIEGDLAKLDLVAKTIGENNLIYLLSLQKGKLPLDMTLRLREAKTLVTNGNQISSVSPFAFLLFRNNDYFISSQQVSDSFSEKYYGTFFSVTKDNKALTAEEIRKRCFDATEAKFFLKVDEVVCYINGVKRTYKEPLLYILRGMEGSLTSPSYYMVFLLSSEELASQLQMREYSGDLFIQVLDRPSGDILIDNKKFGHIDYSMESNISVRIDKQEYWILSNYMKETGWDTLVGVPREYISNQIEDITDLIIIYIVLGIAFAGMLIVFFSYQQYASIRKLLKVVDVGNNRDKKRVNEYDLLYKTFLKNSNDLGKIKEQAEMMQSRNELKNMENYIVRGIDTEETKATIINHMDNKIENYCIVVAHFSETNIERHSLLVLFTLQTIENSLNWKCNHFLTYLEDVLIIIPLDKGQTKEKIQELFIEIAKNLEKQNNVNVQVGISTQYSDYNKMHEAYLEAKATQQAFLNKENSSVNIYKLEDVSQKEGSLVEKYTLLYNNMIAGNKEEIEKFFENLRILYKAQPLLFETQKQQIFYSILNVIQNVANYAGKFLSMPPFEPQVSMDHIMETLSSSAFSVCEIINENKKSKNEELKKKILDYLHRHYMEPSLNAQVVCDEMKISEKYLFNFIKEQTGETFSGYLEGVRIMNALELVKISDATNDDIAEKTGFVSMNTFYRAFKKRTGVTPKIYKENFK